MAVIGTRTYKYYHCIIIIIIIPNSFPADPLHKARVRINHLSLHRCGQLCGKSVNAGDPRVDDDIWPEFAPKEA